MYYAQPRPKANQNTDAFAINCANLDLVICRSILIFIIITTIFTLFGVLSELVINGILVFSP